MLMIFSALASSTLALGGCATQSGGTVANDTTAQVGKAVLITAVDAKCRTELQNYSYWKTLSRTLSSDARTQWETKICGCASNEAVNTTSLTDMVLVANPSTRDAAIAGIAQRTVSTCIQKLSKQ